MLKALLLDLDGTLIDIDGDRFLEEYIERAAGWMEPLVAPERFSQAVWTAAIPLMVTPHPGVSNKSVLWDALSKALEVPGDRLLAHFEEQLHPDRLKGILPGGQARAGAQELVELAGHLGLKRVVATMPIYPEVVVRERLARGGLADIPWDFIATEEMDAVKPHPEYWEAVVRAAGVSAEECLVVGDDFFRDIRPAPAASATFYVGPEFKGLKTGPTGTLTDLAASLSLDSAVPAKGESG